MTSIRVCVDEDVLFDGTLDEWQATPPDRFRDALRPDAKPEPWMKAILVVMADAVMTGNSVSISVATGPSYRQRQPVRWWSMEVANT